MIQRELGRPAPGGLAAFGIDWTVLAGRRGVRALDGLRVRPRAAGRVVARRVARRAPQRQPDDHRRARQPPDALRAHRPRGRGVARAARRIDADDPERRRAGAIGSRHPAANACCRPRSRFASGATPMRPAGWTSSSACRSRVAAIPGVESVGARDGVAAPGAPAPGRSGCERRAVIRRSGSAWRRSRRRISRRWACRWRPAVRSRRPTASAPSRWRSSATRSRAGSRPTAARSGRAFAFPKRMSRGQERTVVRQVVGIAATCGRLRPTRISSDLYVPLPQVPGRFAMLHVRTSGAPAGWLPQLRAAFKEIDPEIPLNSARPLQAAFDEQLARPRVSGLAAGGVRGRRRAAGAGRGLRRDRLRGTPAGTRDCGTDRDRRGAAGDHGAVRETGKRRAAGRPGARRGRGRRRRANAREPAVRRPPRRSAVARR